MTSRWMERRARVRTVHGRQLQLGAAVQTREESMVGCPRTEGLLRGRPVMRSAYGGRERGLWVGHDIAGPARQGGGARKCERSTGDECSCVAGQEEKCALHVECESKREGWGGGIR